MAVEVLNTTALRVYVGGSVIGEATGGTLSLTRELRDLASKDSGSWKKSAPGIKSATLAGNALYDKNATNGFSELWTAWDAGTEVALKYSTNASGDKEYTANGYITTLENSAEGVEQNATYSYTIEINGAVTEATVA